MSQRQSPTCDSITSDTLVLRECFFSMLGGGVCHGCLPPEATSCIGRQCAVYVRRKLNCVGRPAVGIAVDLLPACLTLQTLCLSNRACDDGQVMMIKLYSMPTFSSVVQSRLVPSHKLRASRISILNLHLPLRFSTSK